MESEELQRYFKPIILKPPERDEDHLVNGEVKFNGKDFQITINLALMDFFWHMAKLWATRIGVMDIPGYPREDSKISFDETVNFANMFMTAFCENRICETQIVPALRLSKNQIIWAGNMCHYGERFVVAHEFGHVVIRFAPNRISDFLDWATTQSRRFISPLLNEFPDCPKSVGEDELVQKWSEEFTADLIGMHLVLATTEDEIERIKSYWAAELNFITFSLLEHFYYSKRYAQIYQLTDHPFDMMRLAILRSAADKSTRSDVLEVGRGIEKISRDILLRLGISPLID